MMRFLSVILASAIAALGAVQAGAQDNKIVLFEDPALDAARLNYPLLISQERGYRILCRSQAEEEAMIRGLGLLSAPSQILDAVDPEVISADPAANPFLCPAGPDYDIKVFAADGDDGLTHYFQFPDAIGSTAYTDRIYIPGCTELVDALNIDLGAATAADPTPFFTGKIHTIACLNGTDVEVAPDSFADWCVKGDRTAEQTSAVMALLDITPVGISALDNPSACASASDFLNSISVIDISGKGVTSLEPIEVLPHLTRLSAANNQISDLSPLQGLTALTVLDMSDNDVQSTAALAPLISLSQLDLGGNQIEDIRALSALNALTSLTLDGNRIGDLSPLQFLATLIDLSLAANGLTGEMIEPLTALAVLTSLNLADNNIETFEHLGAFSSTVEIDLSGNPITNGGPATFLDLCILNRDEATPFGQTVRAIVELKGGGTCGTVNDALLADASLDLSTKVISDVAPLSVLTHLTTLNLADNAITDISPLAGLLNLRNLNLANNSIVDIRPAGPLVNLTSFDASGNPIALDDFLSGCLMRNHADTLSPPQTAEVNALLTVSGETTCHDAHARLRQTQFVDARNASLTSLDYFAVLENVRTLDLSDNQLTNVSALSGLSALRTLRVVNNQIASFTTVAALRGLESLSIDQNPLPNLNGVANLTKLRRIFLSNTGVRRVEPLASVQTLEDAGLRNLNLIFTNLRAYCLVHRFDSVALGQERAFMAAIETVAGAANVDVSDCNAIEDWAQDLEVLNLNKKGISSVKPIVFFADLKELHLFDNQISDSGPIQLLNNLEKLSLNKNRIGTAPRLRSTGIKQLYLGDNRIVSINNLSNLTQLQSLNLRNNRITDPATVNGLTSLTFLDLRDNRIAEIQKATAILSRDPYLKGNPVCLFMIHLPALNNACRREPPLLVFPVGTVLDLNVAVERRTIEEVCPQGRCADITIRPGLFGPVSP